MESALRPTLHITDLSLRPQQTRRQRIVIVTLGVLLMLVSLAWAARLGGWYLPIYDLVPALTASGGISDISKTPTAYYLLAFAVLFQWFRIRSTAAYNPRWPVFFVSAHNVVLISAVFILPPQMLPLLAIGYLLRTPVAWHWRIWNMGVGAAALCGAALARLLAMHTSGLGIGELTVLASVAAVLAFWLIESCLTTWANWYADAVGGVDSGLWTWRSIKLDWTILSVGALSGMGLAYSPAFILLALPAVLLVLQTCEAVGTAQVSIYDAKTGLLAPHTLDPWGSHEIKASQRRGTPLSLVMVDLDLFRHINNTYGHQAGDQVLRHAARVLQSTARGSDLAFRFGGEELTLVLPDTDLDGAYALADRFRDTLQGSPAMTTAGPVPVTASAGVAQLEDGEGLEALITRADDALYAAKAAGRNNVSRALHR